MTRPEDASTITGGARTAERAIHQLCRATVTRPAMTVAEVSDVLAGLAAMIAALPQAAGQLGDILQRAEHDRRLVVDTTVETDDPCQAIDTARSQLHAIRAPADEAYRLLDAAHSLTAHIGETGDHTPGAVLDPRQLSVVRRPDHPPDFGAEGRGPASPR